MGSERTHHISLCTMDRSQNHFLDHGFVGNGSILLFFFYYIDFISSLQISISESHLSTISNINLCCFLALTEVSLLQIIYYTNKTRFYAGVDDKGEKEKGSNNSSFVTTSLIEKTALRVTLHNSWPQEKCC